MIRSLPGDLVSVSPVEIVREGKTGVLVRSPEFSPSLWIPRSVIVPSDSMDELVVSRQFAASQSWLTDDQIIRRGARHA